MSAVSKTTTSDWDFSEDHCKTLPLMDAEAYHKFTLTRVAQISSTGDAGRKPIVFGIGAPRSGTLSLANAFHRIGLGPCSWGATFTALPQLNAFFVRALDTSDDFGESEVTDEEIYAALNGWTSLVDMPIPFIWKVLARAYPNAKFVLVPRDPAKWWSSISMLEVMLGGRFVEWVAPLSGDPVFNHSAKMIRAMFRLIRRQAPSGVCPNWIAAHEERVKAGLPPDRLLVWKHSAGYAPLCKFLGMPIPLGKNGEIESIPHINDGESLRSILQRGKGAIYRRVGMKWVAGMLVFFVAFLYFIV